MNIALNEDCMAVMARYPDKYFDLAVVDPPYGIGYVTTKNPYSRSVAEYKEYKPYYGNDRDAPGNEYFLELQRVSKNQVIFGANHFISRIPNADASCWIVWDKENGDNCFADCELALTTFHSAVRIFRFRWQGMLQGNMKNKEIRIHPTQKPMELYRWIYHKYAKPGYKILDTHLGSGSSRRAAHDFNLDFVGCEIDKHYFELQEKSWAEYTSQLNIFNLEVHNNDKN